MVTLQYPRFSVGVSLATLPRPALVLTLFDILVWTPNLYKKVHPWRFLVEIWIKRESNDRPRKTKEMDHHDMALFL